jgi:hypothetical protein
MSDSEYEYEYKEEDVGGDGEDGGGDEEDEVVKAKADGCAVGAKRSQHLGECGATDCARVVVFCPRQRGMPIHPRLHDLPRLAGKALTTRLVCLCDEVRAGGVLGSGCVCGWASGECFRTESLPTLRRLAGGNPGNPWGRLAQQGVCDGAALCGMLRTPR